MASIAAPVDQSDPGHRSNTAPSEGISAGLPHVGQPLVLEPEEPEADQHSRGNNLPTSTTSVTCKRFYSPINNIKILHFFNECLICVSL